MKKIMMILLTTTAFLTSCDKDDPAPAPNPTATAFRYSVDGTDITADSAYAVLYTLGIPPFTRRIDVFAYKSGMEVMEFHLKPTTGTYPADGTFDNAWLTYETGTNFPADFYHSTSGTITLSQCDTIMKKLQGTFSFTGNNGTANKSISNGTLNVDIRIN